MFVLPSGNCSFLKSYSLASWGFTERVGRCSFEDPDGTLVRVSLCLCGSPPLCGYSVPNSSCLRLTYTREAKGPAQPTPLPDRVQTGALPSPGRPRPLCRTSARTPRSLGASSPGSPPVVTVLPQAHCALGRSH